MDGELDAFFDVIAFDYPSIKSQRVGRTREEGGERVVCNRMQKDAFFYKWPIRRSNGSVGVPHNLYCSAETSDASRYSTTVALESERRKESIAFLTVSYHLMHI